MICGTRRARMQDEGRFGRMWAAWDRRVDAGEAPSEILRDSNDEDLVEILGGESEHDRRYARDIIATELLNRLHSRTMKHPAAAKAAEKSAKIALDAAQEGQAAIHHAEELLKESGRFELGDAVSQSAYASLDAAEAAFDAAKEHADSLHQTLAQSRAGRQLSEKAADAGEHGRKVTRNLEKKMESIGSAEEGRAAAEASRRIRDATERAESAAEKSEEKLRER